MTTLGITFLLREVLRRLKGVPDHLKIPNHPLKDGVMRLLNKDLRLQDVTLIYVILLAALVVLLVAPYHASSPSPSSSSSPDGSFRTPLPYHVPLDPAGQLQLSWNISYLKQEVYMELRAKELGYGLLLGMSDRGEPTNADLVLLWSDGHKSYFGVRDCV